MLLRASDINEKDGILVLQLYDNKGCAIYIFIEHMTDHKKMTKRE